jgi:hypothetical protein
MKGESSGAAFRKACQEFEVWWATAVKRLPAHEAWNPNIEPLTKNIARLAFLEGRGL